MLHLVTNHINTFPCFVFIILNTILALCLFAIFTWKHLAKKHFLLVSLFQIALGIFLAIFFQKAFFKTEGKASASPSSTFLNFNPRLLTTDTQPEIELFKVPLKNENEESLEGQRLFIFAEKQRIDDKPENALSNYNQALVAFKNKEKQ